MTHLPKKEQCDAEGHTFWKWETPSGKILGKCQRCGVEKVLHDPNPPPRKEHQRDALVAKILGYT